MTQVYIKEQGARVARDGERFLVKRGRKVIEEIPLGQVDQLVLMGNVQITTQAVHAANEHDIDVVLLSQYGNYRGRWSGSVNQYADLQVAQLRGFADPVMCLRLAQTLIVGKINNQRTLLQRQAGRFTGADRSVFRPYLSGMLQMQRSAETARSLDSLRGFEGKAAAYYFAAVRSLLGPEWGFQKRAYRPAPDPFNALLSFAYTLVQKDVLSAVQLVGLNPTLGFFHVVRPGRAALAIDMMEEWRPVVADALALELVNTGRLRAQMFEQTGDRNRPILLGDAGLRIVLEAYEQRMTTAIQHPLAAPGARVSLRQAMLLQMRQLAQLLRAQRDTFVPLRVR